MQQSSNNSHATSTNIRFGSLDLPDLWWNVHAIEIPTITMDIPKNNSRAGTSATQAPDTCNFTDLTLELSIDKDWKVYKEVYQYFLEGINVENAKFSHFKKFELWVEFVDGKGETQQKFWFHSCRLQDFGGIVVSPNDPEDVTQTLSMTFSVMYYDHDNHASATIEDDHRYADDVPMIRG